MDKIATVQAHQLLNDGLNQLSLALTEAQISQLMLYVNELEKWNKAYNLTAVRSIEEIIKRHILDALSVVQLIAEKKPKTLADIGTGGGIPGVILGIVFPKLSIFLVESIGKKCRFLRHVIQKLGLSERVSIIQQRVESWHPTEPLSIIICRAFTSLQNFTTITQHLGDEKTLWFAMKSAHTQAEEQALSQPFMIAENSLLQVPYEAAQRHLIILKINND